MAIRTHELSRAFETLHSELVAALGRDRVVVVVDHLKSVPHREWPTSYNIVELTDDVLVELGLRTIVPDGGWRCGDYFYYALFRALDVEQAWLIEPDVRFLNVDIASFFAELDVVSADFLAADLTLDPQWLWSHQLTSRGVSDPWRCFFPLTRLSRSGYEAALRLRRALYEPNHYGFPNDEGVVATAIMTSGLVGVDLRGVCPAGTSLFRHRPKLLLPVLQGTSNTSELTHPSVDIEEFVANVRRELLRAMRDDVVASYSSRHRSAARLLETLSDYSLLTKGERPLHESIFGPPDLQHRRQDESYRRDVISAMPIHVRLLQWFARSLARSVLS